jgi:hypothetical protein
MDILNLIFTNGFLPLLPVFAWNIIFASKLPSAFGPENFDKGIPKPVLTGETVFRTIVFLMPLLFSLNIQTGSGTAGLAFYILGLILYFLSWIMLMFFPKTSWSKSVFGFTAPAYTPAVWLAGIGLMADRYYFTAAFSVWHYFLPAVLFLVFHISHTVTVYSRTDKRNKAMISIKKRGRS